MSSKHILTIILAIGASSLFGQKKNAASRYVMANGHKVMVCDLAKVKDTVEVKLSELVETCEHVALETKREAFVKPGRTSVSENYIGVHSWGDIPYKLFDKKSGKYLNDIGSVGRGPNEYKTLGDGQIDEKTQTVYLMPWQKAEVYAYDLKGNPKSSVALLQGQPKSKIYVNSGKDITVLALPFPNTPCVAYKQTLDKKEIHSVKAKPYSIPFDFSNEIFSSGNTEAKDVYVMNFFRTGEDSLYHFVEGVDHLVPVFSIDFPTDKVPIHTYIELPKHYIASLSQPRRKSKNTWTSTPPKYIIVDKETGESHYLKLVNDFYGNCPAPISFTRGMFLWNAPAFQVKEDIEKALKKNRMPQKMKKKLEKMASSIDEEDNNLVFYGKLKQ
ncbi:MAG: 6-bladed beta-propeller [Cytophagales bacterium]|nr:6-bladed beta-propeller [Cytophagales bacterium]